jgi:hypothetical protein
VKANLLQQQIDKVMDALHSHTLPPAFTPAPMRLKQYTQQHTPHSKDASAACEAESKNGEYKELARESVSRGAELDRRDAGDLAE